MLDPYFLEKGFFMDVTGLGKKRKEEAARLADLGFEVVALKPFKKTPVHTGWKEKTWDSEEIFENWQDFWNLGIKCKGLAVIDIDLKDFHAKDGRPCNHWFEALGPENEFHAFAVCSTPNGGRHYYFSLPEGASVGNTTGAIANGVDTRSGEGGFIVAPFSVINKQGGYKGEGQYGQYHWVDRLEDKKEEIADYYLPEWLVFENARASGVAFEHEYKEGDVIGDGKRGSTLFTIAFRCFRDSMDNGMTKTDVLSKLLFINERYCKPSCEIPRVVSAVESAFKFAQKKAFGPVGDGRKINIDKLLAFIKEQSDSMDSAEGMKTEKEILEKQAIENIERLNKEYYEKNKIRAENPGEMPEDFFRVPGFIEELVRYQMLTSPQVPNRRLSFCGALSLLSLATSRKVVLEGFKTNTCLYLLALAPSGAGKEYPRSVNEKLLLEVGGERHLISGANSSEGLQRALFDNKSILYQCDEFAQFLRLVSPNGGRVDPIYRKIYIEVLKNYSQKTLMEPVTKGGSTRKPMKDPCFSILGTSIESCYYDSLSRDSLIDGFLSRLIVVDGIKRTPRRKGEKPQDLPTPGGVLRYLEFWKNILTPKKEDFEQGDDIDLSMVLEESETDFEPSFGNVIEKGGELQKMVMRLTGDGEKVLEEIQEEVEKEYHSCELKGDSDFEMSLWSRVTQNTIKLAMTYQLSCDMESIMKGSPLWLGPDALNWAYRFARHVTLRAIYHVETLGFENLHEKHLNRVQDLFEKNGGSISHSQLVQKTRNIPRKLLADIIEHLKEGEVIEEFHFFKAVSQKASKGYRVI